MEDEKSQSFKNVKGWTDEAFSLLFFVPFFFCNGIRSLLRTKMFITSKNQVQTQRKSWVLSTSCSELLKTWTPTFRLSFRDEQNLNSLPIFYSQLYISLISTLPYLSWTQTPGLTDMRSVKIAKRLQRNPISIWRLSLPRSPFLSSGWFLHFGHSRKTYFLWRCSWCFHRCKFQQKVSTSSLDSELRPFLSIWFAFCFYFWTP